jgi:hypothetical protein
MPAADVHVDDRTGKSADGGTTDIPPADVVEFLSPIEGLLYIGQRAIAIASNLGRRRRALSAYRDSCRVAGANRQRRADVRRRSRRRPLTPSKRRASDAPTAALNPFLATANPRWTRHGLQLTEARMHQRGDPRQRRQHPRLLRRRPGRYRMTYTNAQQAKQDLLDFGAMPYLQCIEQTLGGPNVTPRGQFVRLDANAWLRNPFQPAGVAPQPNDAQIAFNPDTQPVEAP